ncbi:hypothetical protein [Streptomyces sp. NPDC095613]|uniref:hypothetical protein n=1 Tax=Streptomyces sp. NPDC095613 TaxID=3155540 RepID=UPI00333049D5
MTAKRGVAPSEQNASDQTSELEVRETFKRASEFAPHVTVTEETFFSHGWQPLTITVLQSLWFLPADASFDIPFLVDWYARLGWKGANGKPLGANVVRREIGLIRDAGYVSVTRLRGETGQAVGIQYSVSQRRTDQPQNGPWLPADPGKEENRRSHHMPPMATRGQSPHVAIEENPSSDHMPPMTTCGQSPHVANAAKPQVAPRATNGVHPPFPPGGGTTPPPNPLTHPDGAGSLPSQTEEGGVFDENDLEAAAAFLQQMPDPWVIGERDAREMAPELLASMQGKGWPRFADVDAKSLTSCLTVNPGGANNLPSILRRKRIPNLPAYSRVAARAARRSNAPEEGMCARHPGYAEDDCSACRKAEMERTRRPAAEPGPVDGLGLLASLLQMDADQPHS